jgi:histone arginine demethylase JMJD6
MSVDRRQRLSHREFLREYLRPPHPVIVTDATAGWPALRKWTPGFFAERYGHLSVTLDGRTMTLRELVAEVEGSTPERPAPYLHNQLLAKWPRELLDDVTPLPRFALPNWLDSPLFPSREHPDCFEVYIGGRGAAFPVLHYDGLHTHAVIMQIYGEKEFSVYPPEQTPLLYPRPGDESNKSQVEDLEHPDLERFPLFARASPTRFVLQPGETLFVPAGWWHTTRLLTTTISVSVNAANRANWRDFKRDYCANLARERGRLRATVTSAYMTVLGAVLNGVDHGNRI